MAILATLCTTPTSVSVPIRLQRSLKNNRKRSSNPTIASLSSSPSPESSKSTTTSDVIATSTSPNKFVNSSSRPPNSNFDYSLTNPNGNPVVSISRPVESKIERIIFDFRFLALLAVGGSLAGSLLCFLNGCVHIFDAYKIYWTSCVKGVHSGQMVLRLVEAIDIYLAGTVMLIFAMGLYGLFISNVSPGLPPHVDRALKSSSFFGMFALKMKKSKSSTSLGRGKHNPRLPIFAQTSLPSPFTSYSSK